MDKCPQCTGQLCKRILASRYVAICDEQYLLAMDQLQRAEDAGKRGEMADGGQIDGLLPFHPKDKCKYAYCWYCTECELVIVQKNDVIPLTEIPSIAQ